MNKPFHSVAEFLHLGHNYDNVKPKTWDKSSEFSDMMEEYK